MNFSSLSFYIICFSGASLLFDLVSLYQIKKGYVNAIIATLSLLIDIGMEVLAIFLVCMLWKATATECTRETFRLEVVLMSSLIVLRVIHLPIMILAICCCVPCYFFPRTCCIRRWLIEKNYGVNKQIFDMID